MSLQIQTLVLVPYKAGATTVLFFQFLRLRVEVSHQTRLKEKLVPVKIEKNKNLTTFLKRKRQKCRKNFFWKKHFLCFDFSRQKIAKT